MDTLVSYLIKSVSISGLLLLYYWVVLRNRKFHSFNRACLLSVLLASLILPLIRLPWLALSWLKLHIEGSRSTGGLVGSFGAHPVKIASFSVMGAVLVLCASVSVVFLLVLAARIFAVYQLKWRHPSQRMEGCHFIEIRDRRAPFSFLDNLFWQKGSDINDPIHRKVFTHELAHIRGRHTYDNLFVQFLCGVFWMNPFYWLIRQELMMVHEFIADDASIAEGDTESFARMLLQAYDEGRYLDPSHRFFHSPIKRRLVMIASSQRPSRYPFRKLLAVPVLLAVMVLSCSKEQTVAPAQSKPGQPMVLNINGKFKSLPANLKLKLNYTVKNLILEKVQVYGKTGDPKELNLTIDTTIGRNPPEHIQILGRVIPDEHSGQ
jgi:hypothetical protein